jgi:hypothetical protein
MKLLSARARLLLAGGIVLITFLLFVVNFTGACRLETVTLNGRVIDDWPQQFSVLNEESVFRQPLDSLADMLLSKEGVFKVDVAYAWPRTLNVTTNAFTPVAFVLDKSSGTLKGLERNGRVIPLDNAVLDWEQPVLTGVTTAGWFDYCEDARVKVVVDELEQLRRDHIDFYRLIDEVNLDRPEYLTVSVAGLPYELKVRAERLRTDLGKSVDFITRFDPGLTEMRCIDLRFDDMIVCAQEGK